MVNGKDGLNGPDGPRPDPETGGEDASAPSTGRHRRIARPGGPATAGTPGTPRRSRRGLVVLAGVAFIAGVAALSTLAYASVRSQDTGPAALAHDPSAPAAFREPSTTPATTPSAAVSPTARTQHTPTPTPSSTPSRTARPRSGAAHHDGRPSAPRWQTQVVRATYVIDPGESVRSNRLSLSLQTSGDLVLRDEHGAVTWSSGTHAQGTHAVFQDDGNFVLYQGEQTLWSSRTNGHNGATLKLNANGTMTIDYAGTTLWST